MTFNIGGYSTDCAKTQNWMDRGIVCIDILKRHNADLIGFQEVQSPNRTLFDEQLTDYAYEYGTITCQQTDPMGMYNPIYWKKGVFEKLDVGTFYLSKSPHQWSRSWDAMYVRSANWVLLRYLQTGVTFIYLNVHLDNRGAKSRIESSKLILRKIGQHQLLFKRPIIIAGDFNARAWSPPDENVNDYPTPVSPQHLPVGSDVHSFYMAHGFKDAYLEVGNCNQLDMNTYHDYYGDGFPPVALRIDWVLTLDGMQKIQTLNYTLIRDAIPPIYGSDHYPIMAELAFG